MNKKKVSLIGVILFAVLATTATAMFLSNSGLVKPATLIAYAAGTPDALGNHISSIVFWQNSTGTWNNVGSLVASNYVLNYNLTIPANQQTLVYCNVQLNQSLAADVATAESRVRVYLTISGVVTSASMTVWGGALLLSGYYELYLAWPSTVSSPTSTWTPSTDTTYTITFQFQAYY